MQIPVVIEPVAGNGYRAKSGEPLALSAEGNTLEEALLHLRQLIRDRLAAGVHLMSLDLPTADNPWQKYAGTLKDDPLFEPWQQAIAEYRQQRDALDAQASTP